MPASGNGNAAGVTRLVTSNSRMCKIGMPYLASVLVSSFHARRPDESTSVRSVLATTLKG